MPLYKEQISTWRLNTNILNDPDMKERLQMEIEMYLDHNDNNDLSFLMLWDKGKRENNDYYIL